MCYKGQEDVNIMSHDSCEGPGILVSSFPLTVRGLTCPCHALQHRTREGWQGQLSTEITQPKAICSDESMPLINAHNCG